MELVDSVLSLPRHWWFVIAAVVVVITPWLVRAPLRRALDARRIRRAVRSLGAACAHDLTVPDDMDGTVHIDHAVMTREYLLLIQVKRYPGAIFGAAQIDQWAQVMREGSFKFPNPLAEVQDMVATVRARLPDVPVRGAVLFDRDSSFPKGKPDGVLHVPEIDPRRPRPELDDVPQTLRQAWARLV